MGPWQIRYALRKPSHMLWRVGLSLGLLVLVTVLAAGMGAPNAWAQGPVTPRHTDPTWHATYWNNTSLFGSPVLQREDPDLNFDWGTGSPASAVHPDRFSARWTRYISVTPGMYTFQAESDDGIRVWVDGDLIIDAWWDHGALTFTGTKYLGAGHHLVKVEYYENTGLALARVSWQRTEQPITHWKGEYFNNMSLSGPPAVVRDDAAIDFNWGPASPAPGVDADGFSVRWSQNLNFDAGMYRFRMTVDDGGRLFVNGHTLIDAWKVQAPTEYTGEIYLPGGAASVQMEYFENTGGAVARLTWERVDAVPTATPTPTPTPPPLPSPTPTPVMLGWRAEYWNNMSLSGAPVLVRDEPEINHNWGYGSPDPVVQADNFSARWSRSVKLLPGAYRFSLTVDDGGRLYLNGRLVIDAWREQAATTYTTIFNHGGGLLEMQVEYFENRGAAVARLYWEPVSGPTPTPTPAAGAVIVDDLDSGFVRGGYASGWGAASDGYAGHLYWTQNNDRVRPGYNWGRWYPSLQPGRYEVFVYIPDRYTTTGNARYWISHAGGFTLRTVNQGAYSNQWVSLGVYTFRGDSRDYVSLADVTYEPRLSRLIAWDAVKWVPR